MNVTIVGGGFGGIKAALELIKNKNNQVTLITDRPDFQYYPALYSTATGHSHLQSWVPLGEIFADKDNITIYIDKINTIDKAAKTLTAVAGTVYKYETCIIAIGSVTTYFGIEGIDTYAYGIKSAGEIQKLKQHLYTDMGMNHTMDKYYVVVGAGPTGIELASALGSYLERLRRHYHLKKRLIHIDLVEAAPRILPKMSEKASRKVAKRLKKLGVSIMTNKKVESETADTLMVSGKPISSHTVIWTSGVANNPFFQKNASSFELAPNGRVKVDEYMKAGEDVYVIGDNALTQYGGLAQTALHDAIFVATNLKRLDKGKKPKKYKAVMPPVVVPVGKNWAVFSWKKILITGWVAARIRSVADVVGYSDMLPFGQALGVWHAEKIMEDDYFPGK